MVTPRVVHGHTTCGTWSHHVWCMVTPCVVHGHTMRGAWSHHMWCMVTPRVVHGHTTCGACSHHVWCMVTLREGQTSDIYPVSSDFFFFLFSLIVDADEMTKGKKGC